MKTKAAGIFSKCKYGLAVFIILTIQAVINMIPFSGTGEFLHVYYLVDFSMGKASRLLIGTVVNWLTDNPDIDWVNKFAAASVFLAIIITSCVIGKIINGIKPEMKPHVLVVTLFLVSGSLTFAIFSRFIGFLDIYMFIVALSAVIFLNNKYLRWLTPLLCVAGVFIHQGFVLSFFPLIALSSFYLAFVHEKNVSSIAVFVLSMVLTAVSVIYCVIYGTETMTLTFEEMCRIVNERGSHEFSDEALFNLGFYFYEHAPDKSGLTNAQLSEMSLWEVIVSLFTFVNFQYDGSLRGLFAILSLALIMFVIFAIIWIKCIMHADSKPKKFVYACFMLSMLIVPLYCLIASDYARWVQAGMLTQFGFAFLMFFIKDAPFEKALMQLGEFFKSKKFLLVMIYLVYAFAVQRDVTS